jgi:GGDEF domain-containing protein
LRIAIYEKKYCADNVELSVSASFGVIGYAADSIHQDISAENMLKQLDGCLYKAKKNGRNRVEGRLLK